MVRFKEAAFPLVYRQREVTQVMQAVARRRSIAVCGLAGMGKSNVLRFIAAHRDVKGHYLQERSGDLVWVHLDCNRLDGFHPDEALEQLSSRLAEAGVGHGPNLDDAAALSTRHLKRLLEGQLRSLPPSRHLVFVLDRFDAADSQLGPDFFRFLRAVRDLQGNVSYIFGSRRPLVNLPELIDLFVAPCWVGPLTEADALDSLARDEGRLGVHFSDEQKARLLEISGGHPGLLKNAVELLADGQVAGATTDALCAALLAQPVVEHVCLELWGDLTAAEQEAAQRLTHALPLMDAVRPAVESLTAMGVARRTGERPTLFAPLFAAYVARQPHELALTIEVGEPNEVVIRCWNEAQTVTLRPLLHKLLRYIARRPERLHGSPQLSDALWPGEWPSRKESLERAVADLRQDLNPPVRQLTGDTHYNCLRVSHQTGYQFNLHPRGGWRIELRGPSS